MKKLKVILIGAGLRGTTYTDAMQQMSDKFEVVAVAEPIKSRREYIKNAHNLPDNMCFCDWKPLLDLGKIADIAIIATMDRDHFEPALKAIDLRYDILLEKPIAPTAKECAAITAQAKKNDVKVIVCTVLRYTPIFMKLKDIIDSGAIGNLMSIVHEECVGNVHQSHSFVRGNWGNSERSSDMLLQKSCHDMDILQWLVGKKCVKVQSFGHLSYFKRQNAPKGAPEYCIEGCPNGDTCPYNAVKLYLESDSKWFRDSATREVDPSDEMVKEAIAKTQYGKCVFKCDNNVVDHQTVNMLFEDDVTVTFSMNAFNKGGRFIHIMGTKGEIRAAMDGETPIEVYEFETKNSEIIDSAAVDGINGGHGGGDKGIVGTLYEYITGTYSGKSVPDIEESCNNHYIVFAAEKSRSEGVVVDFDEFVRELKL